MSDYRLTLDAVLRSTKAVGQLPTCATKNRLSTTGKLIRRFGSIEQELRHPHASHLDDRGRGAGRASPACARPAAIRPENSRALARALRSGLQARLHQARLGDGPTSTTRCPKIAPRAPGMVVVGTLVVPSRAPAVTDDSATGAQTATQSARAVPKRNAPSEGCTHVRFPPA